MVFLRAVCFAAVLALVSCWTPVFNQDLSVAELVRSKLQQDYDHTTTLNNGGNNEGDVLQAGVSFDGQPQVILSSNHNQVNVLWSFNSTGQGNSVQLDTPLSDPSQVMIQSDLSAAEWYIPTLYHSGGGVGDVRDTATNNGSTYSSSWATPDSLLGFATAQYTAGAASIYYLTKTSANVATLGQYQSTSLFSSVAYSGGPGWMAVNPSGTNGYTVYLTHAPDSSGKYVTDMLDPTGLRASWQGHDHVAGFLSTGRLLTREGSFYNVCDTTGKVLYSFPAGTLQFAGEYFDSGSFAMRVRFSEALLQVAQNGGQDKVRVRIYSIATSKLDSLQQ